MSTNPRIDLLGLSMRFGDIATDVIKAGIDEHGLEPIQLYVPVSDLAFMNGLPYPLAPSIPPPMMPRRAGSSDPG